MVEVTQADRDAAEHFMDSYLDGSSFCEDRDDLVKAFSVHRAAAHAQGWRDAIEAVAGVASKCDVALLGYQPVEEHMRAEMADLADSIRAIPASEVE